MFFWASVVTLLAAFALLWLKPELITFLISPLIDLGLLPPELGASSLEMAVAMAQKTRRLELKFMSLASAEVLDELRKLEELEAFMVEDCALHSDDVPPLVEALKGCTELSFLRCSLAGLLGGLAALAPRAFRLRECQLKADDLAELSTLVRALPDVSAAELLASLPGDGEAVVSPGKALKPAATPGLAANLVALDLSENCLTGAGRSLSALLRHGLRILLLQLEDCQLNLDDLTQLARALSRSRVERLDLAGNDLRQEGLQVLARSLPTSQVQDLGLERNGIAVGDALNELKLAYDKRPFLGLRLHGNELSSTELRAFIASLKASAASRKGEAFCPPGCKCFEGRGEVM